MPFIKVYIHFVWNTRYRQPFLNTLELRQKMWEHIRMNGSKKEIFIDSINGYEEHCHCLISINSDQTLQKIMHLLKGESSNWMNKTGLIKTKFEWQDEYYAASVSESMVPKVREYIRNQEAHHQKKSYLQEFEEDLIKDGFQKFKDT